MALGNVHLTPQLVQAVREAADIVGIASEHTRLQRAGRRHKGLCPLHKEKTPSFSIDETQGLFYCFGCGQGGDAIKLHMLLSGDDFPAAIESLALRYGIPLPSRSEDRRAGGGRQHGVETALEAARGFFVEQLGRSAEARAYLARRRIPAALSERFGLGYAPEGWRVLLDALGRRVPAADLEAAGLLARPERGGDPYDRFRNRLMFPIHDASGRLVGFGGRALGEDRAKYLNTAETEWFHKGRLLYGLDKAKRTLRESGRAVLVEGYTDVLACAASGVEGVVGSMGTALTPEQTRLLARFTDEVVVAYDGDDAGEEAFRRALRLLLGEGLGVLRTRFQDGHDPDSLRLAEGEEALAEALRRSEDGVLLELERRVPPAARREPRLQARAAREVVELLQPIRDGVLRFGYGCQAAARLGIPEGLLWKRLSVDRTALLDAATPTPPAAAPPSPVRSLEERVLELLLGDGPHPPADQLPPEEAFLLPPARNIYRAVRALYVRGGGPPRVRETLGELAGSDEAVDHLARLLLESPFGPRREGELEGSLRELWRRWRKQRRRELAADINEAQQSGDEEKVRRLLQERDALSREIHGRA